MMLDLPARPKRPENETPLMRRIIVALNRLPGVRAARNNNGSQENKHGDWITYGLGDGSPDIQCRMQVPGPRGVLPCVFWIEVKTPHGRTTKKRAALQKMFRDECATRGELSAIAHSEEEACMQAEAMRAEYLWRAGVGMRHQP